MADDVRRTREINFQGVNGDNNSRTLCNECNACKCTSTSAWMAILVTCAGTRARIKPRTLRYHVGVACRLPNKSLPVKNIPGPLGKRRNDGLLSRNRETFQLKVEPDATSSFLFSASSPVTRHSREITFYAWTERSRRRLIFKWQNEHRKRWKIEQLFN